MKLTIFEKVLSKAVFASLLLTIFLLTNSSAQDINGRNLNGFRLKDKLSLNNLTAASDNISNELAGKTERNVIPTIPLKHVNLLDELTGSEKQFSSVFENTQKKKKKSVGLGILLSAVIPGAGELYGESYLKAGIFFAVELLAWGTYLYFDNKGSSKEEEYHQFADANWDVRRYARWLNDQFQAGVDPQAELQELRRQIIAFESGKFSHTLPEYGSQQYYELIGKYQNFMGGWADAESNGNWVVTSSNYFTYKTPMFLGYADDRQKANDFYDYAKIGPVTAILNHVLSAADAAWVISTYNSKIKVETGFRMDNRVSPYTYEFKQIPTFNISVGF